MTIFRGPGGTGSATSDSDTTEFQEFLVQSQAARDAALAAQAAAELAETNAETAETNAETAETNAETAATNAASSASAAASSASSASTSATNAASSASEASTSATNASASASAAAASASAALTSENNAETAETNAAASASAAASSASTATTQASNAAASASAALASETAAASSASSASSSASAASISASNAATSASNAASSATSAANSASAAAASAASINPADIVHISGTETITGAKTFSQTITGSITGNAGTVSNGVYTTGDQTIAGTKTFSSNPVLSAGTANGVAYLNGSKVLTSGSTLTFDGTNLGIGTSSPNEKITIASSTAASYLQICDSATGTTSGDGLFLGSFNGNAELKTKENLALAFGTNNTERARIDSSGYLWIKSTGGTSPWDATSGTYAKFGDIYPIGATAQSSIVAIFNRNTSTGALVECKYNGAVVGSISVTGSTTSYNTSSDYRLKENVQPMTGALSKVAALKPCTYTWKSTGEAGEGFIAHELAEVVPDAVTGEKDAVNEDGSIKPQGIDTSFLVATLTAAIQELKAEFDAYKATHP